MRLCVLWVCFILVDFGLAAQEVFFLPTQRDFILYDALQKKVLHRFDYEHSQKGILWRPTLDGQYIFTKKSWASPEILRQNCASQKQATYRSLEAFTDFQVINADLLVVRQEQNLYLWDLVKNKRTLLLHSPQMLFFAYDEKSQITVVQNESGSLWLYPYGQEKPNLLTATLQLGTFFTLTHGQVTFMPSAKIIRSYQLSTQQSQSCLLSKARTFAGLWPMPSGSFFALEYGEARIDQVPGWRFAVYDSQTRLLEELLAEAPVPRGGYNALITNPLIIKLT